MTSNDDRPKNKNTNNTGLNIIVFIKNLNEIYCIFKTLYEDV